ncbi:chemotaxis protein CheB [Thermodesulfobacteriota bacterium]
MGIILTGMGEDGAKGMLKMRKGGAFTIGQNRDTCTVYSMPKVANDIGGIDIELDLVDIITQVNSIISNT